MLFEYCLNTSKNTKKTAGKPQTTSENIPSNKKKHAGFVLASHVHSGCLGCVTYGVATISRLLKTISHFCKRALSKRRYYAKETYNFQEPTNHSHPIFICVI